MEKSKLLAKQIVKCGLFLIAILFLLCCAGSYGQNESSAAPPRNKADFVAVSNLQMRDPFVLLDPASGKYYTYANNRPGIKVYESAELKNWRDLGNAFVAPPGFWGKTDFWAPDCYYYKGRYYMMVTFSDTAKRRGTSILVSRYPHKDFKPLTNRPVTPKNWMCLDGALYIDTDKTPWLLFSREWLEVGDGEIYAQKLNRTLTRTTGKPFLLFRASEAPWVKELYSREHNKKGIVTDAPFVHRTTDGQLLLLWSSFNKEGKYAMGVACSKTGNILGPWVQSVQPLNSDDGGHGMLFRDKAGTLKIAYHVPNRYPERPVFKTVRLENGMLQMEE